MLTTIFLRFVFGAILAGGLALWCHLGFVADVIFIFAIATIAAVWGDKFLLGFMTLMRYFR